MGKKFRKVAAFATIAAAAAGAAYFVKNKFFNDSDLDDFDEFDDLDDLDDLTDYEDDFDGTTEPETTGEEDPKPDAACTCAKNTADTEEAAAETETDA